MLICLIGTAAGGGVPQWNCSCACCSNARIANEGQAPDGETPELTRLHASVAFSATGDDWYLINATPDVARQIEKYEMLQPRLDRIRNSPIRGVFLTDAELDHTIGLLVLREGAQLELFGTQSVLDCLSSDFPVRKMLDTYGSLTWKSLVCGGEVELEDGLLAITPFPVSSKRPRYANSQDDGSFPDWVVGYLITDRRNNETVAVAPQISEFSAGLCELLASANTIFLDGTCYYEDDMKRAGAGDVTATDMGHLPISGDAGVAAGIQSVNRLRAVQGKPASRAILFHINNTNPILCDQSDEYAELLTLEVSRGEDGLLFHL